MRKIIAIVCLTAILALALVSCGPRFDTIKEKLEKEKYSITVIEGDDVENYDLDKNEIKAALIATKGSDMVLVVEYKNTDLAKKTESDANKLAGMVAGRNGKIVYFGTEAAVNLIK